MALSFSESLGACQPLRQRFGARVVAGRICLALTLLALSTVPPAAMAQGTGTMVKFDFGTFGIVEVDLFNQLTPLSTANFLQNYVNTGLYNNTMIHRVTHLTPDGLGVVQGGGFDTQANQISSAAPVNLEYSAPNLRGTLAMARTNDPNSGTSQWFFNDTDNSVTLAPNAVSGSAGYAVFGQVVGPGMTTIDAISALPTFAYNDPFGQVPLQNFTQTDQNNGADPLPHVVVLNSVTVLKTHPSYQNPFLITDVNNDGILSPSDLATVVADVTVNGIHVLNAPFAGGSYLDVSGDGKVSPLDIARLVEAFTLASSQAIVAQPQAMAMPLADSMAVAPEPSSLALAAISILAFGGYAIRRRSRRISPC